MDLYSETVMQGTQSMAPVVRLGDVFHPAAILIGVNQQSKQDIVKELVHHLVALSQLHPSDEKVVVDQIMNREKVGTTALGNGIAVPNCLSGSTDGFLGVLGIKRNGIEFNALDGELVQHIFLVVAPPNRREEHFELLGKIVAVGRDKSLRLQLQGCSTAEAVHHFLQEFDRNSELGLRPLKGRRFL